MQFRFNLAIEIERPAGDLSAAETVDIQLVYQGGKWRAQCQDPPVATLVNDTFEEALVAAVREIEREWAAELHVGNDRAGPPVSF